MPAVISGGRVTAIDRAGGFDGLVPNTIALYNDRLLDYGAIFRTQPNVRTVVDFLARNIAQLGVHLYRRVDDNDRERVVDHRFPRRLRRPNPPDRRTSRYRLIYALVQNVCIYDTAFAVFTDPGDDDELLRAGPRIVTLPTASVSVTGDNWLWPAGYRLRRSRGDLDLPLDAVIHLQGSANVNDPRFGVSPIEALRSILAEDVAAAEYRESFWSSGARISGVINRPVTAPRWSPAAKERFRESWREAYAGRGSDVAGTPILEDGMTWHEAGMSAREAQYVEARKLTREEVAAAFHVHPAFVGILEHANFSNMREQHRALYADTLGPWLTMLDLDLTNQVLPAYVTAEEDLEDMYVEINFREKLRGSLEEEADAIVKLTGAPTLTRNEGRALLNRNAVPGGDALITPLNVVAGGQTIPGEAPPGDTPRETGTSAVPSGPAKAAPAAGHKAFALPAALDSNHVAAHLTQLRRFFERQAAEVSSTRGARPWADLPEIFDTERWDSELAVDLAGLAETTAGAYAEVLAEAWEFDGFDPDALTPLIVANAGASARNINATTAAQLADAQVADDPDAAFAAVFAAAAGARAAQIARTRTTWAGNFGRVEVARQSGRRSKIWVVTSATPRASHAVLAGETVPIGSAFSNGMAWPGDPAGGAAEVANCSCTLDFTETE